MPASCPTRNIFPESWRKVVESALIRKGFVQVEGDHHRFVYIDRNGLKSLARTKTSHSPRVRDIPDNLLGEMARQCLLAKKDFLRLVDCPMERDEFEEAIRRLDGLDPERSRSA